MNESRVNRNRNAPLRRDTISDIPWRFESGDSFNKNEGLVVPILAK
jgi:hypothetical protein